MPFDYGFRLDKRQRIANAKPIEATKINRSMELKVCFLGAARRRTLICCRSIQISASSACPRLDQIDDHPNNEPDKITHPATASPESRSTASQIGFATGTGVPHPVCRQPSRLARSLRHFSDSIFGFWLQQIKVIERELGVPAFPVKTARCRNSRVRRIAADPGNRT
jgi:hypothetical protein